MKILVAIDSSAASQAVISKVRERRWPEDTVARILSVVGSVAAYNGVPDCGPLVNTETISAKALVRSAVDQLAARGIESHGAVTPGDPRIAIVAYAQQWRPDFVFIGSHGHSGLTRFLLGSVAKTVLRNAPCSIGILRPSKRDRLANLGMKLLLATDGSKYSEAAIRSVAERPWSKGTKIKTVSVISVPEIVTYPLSGLAGEVELIDRAEKLKKEWAKEALRTAGKILSSAGMKSEAVELAGDPKTQIIDEAKKWDADLIVAGARGAGAIDRILSGSVSEAVAIHAHCSVEVIHDCARFSEGESPSESPDQNLDLYDCG